MNEEFIQILTRKREWMSFRVPRQELEVNVKMTIKGTGFEGLIV
jgi:hypothetical protein